MYWPKMEDIHFSYLWIPQKLHIKISACAGMNLNFLTKSTSGSMKIQWIFACARSVQCLVIPLSDGDDVTVSVMLFWFSFLHRNMGGIWESQLSQNEEGLWVELPYVLVIAENNSCQISRFRNCRPVGLVAKLVVVKSFRASYKIISCEK